MRSDPSSPGTLRGSQSEVRPISRLLLKHARDAFGDQAQADDQWRRFGWTACPDVSLALRQYEEFVSLLDGLDVEITYLPRDETGLDSIYVRDASVVCDRGVILCRMGKEARHAEPAAQESALRARGVPVLGSITGEGRLEGGDVVWIDPATVAVGQGYRSNAEGIRQLRNLLDNCIEDFMVVPLPHWRGPGDVFHLMSMVSPLDRDLMLVYSPLLPVPFREDLLKRGIRLVEVCDEEFATLGCNVLAIAPRHCIMPAGNPRTRRRLERAGVAVREYEGSEISAKGGGGPTCLTRPLERSG